MIGHYKNLETNSAITLNIVYDDVIGVIVNRQIINSIKMSHVYHLNVRFINDFLLYEMIIN